MIIYLIRHGETTGDIEDRYGGDYDDHLTEKGREQAEKLAKELENNPIKFIYSSPRIRARETANILSKQIHINFEIVENLRERNGYGILTGMTKEEAKEKHPEEVSKLIDIRNHNVTNSESYEELTIRVKKVFQEILKKTDKKIIAIISHGGFIRCILHEVFGAKYFNKLDDCAYFVIENNEIVKVVGAE